MKTRSIGVLGAATFATAASMFVASGANADLIGLMASQRTVTGGVLVNVFAVVNNGGDVILSVSGGQNGSIRSSGLAGGFLQGTGVGQSVWAPSGSQSWSTLDSFLTVGGGFSTTTNNFTANAGTTAEPNWNVDFEGTSTNTFTTPSDPDTGFVNPYLNSCPNAPGYFLVGTNSPARSLATIASTSRIAATSAAARDGTFGFMIAQFYVASALDTPAEKINFDNMRIFIRAGSATGAAQDANFGVFEIPAPGAVALVGLAGLAGRRRRA